MFPVKNFYTQVLGITPPSTCYQFDIFDPALFHDGFFNKGRQVVYGDLTKCWYPASSRPALGGAPVTPPLAEVAWVKPAYVTWGTPNTLTVAGYARNGTGGVQVRWRDVTTGGPEQIISFQPTPAADTTWSNTIPTSNHCHDYEVYVNYSGSTSNTFFYSGLGSGYCPQRASVTWIQPQWSAGIGTPGSLVVTGTAANAPAGTTVKLFWRNESSTTPNTWNQVSFAAPVASDGAWYNEITNVNYSHNYEVYVKYDAFTSRPCVYNGNHSVNWCEVNWAAPSTGATVTASSTYNAGYPVSAVNNGDRKGLNWGAGGGWNDGTFNAYPDWVQVDFNAVRRVDQVNVFTLQDNYGNPVEPVDALTFSAYGLTNLTLEYWDDAVGAWKLVPGATVAANNKVWTRFLFSMLSTSRIRVMIAGALFNHSRITEIEAWGIPPTKSNHASAARKAVATASSSFSAGYPPAAVINGDRKGVNWGAGGGWNDATPNAFPDWVQVDFEGARTIDEINVFTLQDNYGSPVDPTETMTFTTYGITAFEVQYFNGSSWVTVPGGSVFGNNKVWRKFLFAPVTTSKIRVLVNNGLSSYSRITEVEALGW
jgi:F5/8 type C domain